MSPLTLIQETTWNDVFAAWRAREADWGWPEVARSRGYDSWDAWRMTYCEPLGLPTRRWALYRVEQPLVFAPQMWVGAFRGWRRYFPEGVTRLQFSDLVRNEMVRENDKVAAILSAFPRETTIIGVRCGDDVMCGEGTHRSAALAIMAADGTPVETELTVALTEFAPEEQALFDAIRTQGATPWESAR